MKCRILGIISLLVLVLMFVGCVTVVPAPQQAAEPEAAAEQTTTESETTKVAMILPGPIGDHGVEYESIPCSGGV